MVYANGERSSFPGKEDKFRISFDLSHNQLQNARKLNELRTQKEPLTPSQEQEILSLTSELRDNIISSEDINLLYDGVYRLQRFFNHEVHGYILERQAEWDTYVDDFNYQGRWEPNKEYLPQNMVTLPSGSLYISRVKHTSSQANQPSQWGSTDIWGLIGTKGDKGDPGLNLAYKGTWASNINYKTGDAVTHINMGVEGGLIYYAKRDNVGKAPHESAEDWALYTQIWTHRDEPVSPQEGTHFIQVLT